MGMAMSLGMAFGDAMGWFTPSYSLHSLFFQGHFFGTDLGRARLSILYALFLHRVSGEWARRNECNIETQVAVREDTPPLEPTKVVATWYCGPAWYSGLIPQDRVFH